MTTSVDLSHFSLAQLHRPTPKTLHSDRLQNITSITSHVMTNFVFKFITFRYCINKGWSSNRLNDNVQLANTEIRCKMWGPMSQIMANLELNFHVVVTLAPGGLLAQI